LRQARPPRAPARSRNNRSPAKSRASHHPHAICRIAQFAHDHEPTVLGLLKRPSVSRNSSVNTILTHHGAHVFASRPRLKAHFCNTPDSAFTPSAEPPPPQLARRLHRQRKAPTRPRGRLISTPVRFWSDPPDSVASYPLLIDRVRAINGVASAYAPTRRPDRRCGCSGRVMRRKSVSASTGRFVIVHLGGEASSRPSAATAPQRVFHQRAARSNARDSCVGGDISRPYLLVSLEPAKT